MPKEQSRRGTGGSHGSITKAGKVRNNTPNRGVPTIKHNKRKGPRMSNRREYEKMIMRGNQRPWEKRRR